VFSKKDNREEMMIRDDLLFVFGERHFSFVVFLCCFFVFFCYGVMCFLGVSFVCLGTGVCSIV